jgi:hypothetical protein
MQSRLRTTDRGEPLHGRDHIEKTRPALVLVPGKAEDTPQVLPVRVHEYRAVADALVTIGIRLAESPDGG